MDPNNATNDISVGTTSAPTIANGFAAAADAIRRKMTLTDLDPTAGSAENSVLGPILGGNYKIFESHRNRLRGLSTKIGRY